MWSAFDWTSTKNGVHKIWSHAFWPSVMICQVNLMQKYCVAAKAFCLLMPTLWTVSYCCWASAGSRPYSLAMWDFWLNGSICDCSAVQSAVCLSKCIATCHFVLFSCEFKICAEVVVHCIWMSAVLLNVLNGKNRSRSIFVQNIFFGLFFLF